MVSQRRGSAVFTTTMMLCLVALFHFGLAQAATYVVGGLGGWTFNVSDWPRGKRFRAGDTLVFNYNKAIHNLVVVDNGGYQGCTTPRGAKVFQTGRDQIKLVKGPNFFICSVPGHCQSGMKIAVTAI